MLGTVSAFAYRHRETEKNLCRGGRSQDLKMDIRQVCLKDGLYVYGWALFSITFWYCSCLIMVSNESEGIWKEKMVYSW